MALKLILGNSGSGKTEYIYEQVVKLAEANPRKNYLCLVPEQYTMQTQRKLVDLSSNKAIMNIDVLSFQRLAFRVFDEMGMADLQILEETGKNLVLRKVAQEKAADLTVLKGNMHRMGYISEVKSFISEMMQYNISPQQLQDVLQERDFSQALSGKLQDVQVMYQGFVDFLQGHFITNEELLHVLMQVAEDSEILKDSVLVLDEFTGFTPVQVELLRKLFNICEDVWVALTIDAKEDFYHSKGMQELFDMPKKTIQVLRKLAEETHTEVLEPVVLRDGNQKRFKEAKALYFMEQNLFRPTYRRMLEETDEIQIYSMKTPRDEMVWTARKINDLVQKQGYRYRDIAVVSGNMEGYANYVEQICGKYQIPYFLDATKEVLFHPFIEFVRAILEVLEQDFSYNALMRLLRTGYCNVEQEDVDRLENYLLATGIRGKKMWSNRWLRLPRNEKAYDLERLETLRQQIWQDFAPLLTAFSKKNTAEVCIKAMYNYITGLDVAKQLAEREQELLAADEQAKAKEYAQIYRIVMDLFQKVYSVLGQEVLTVEELGEILDSGFEAARVAVIPPGYDSVTFGDIERTRLNHVKILIFLGVNEGIVPKSSDKGGIISQYERDVLEEAQITLAPGAREQAFIQKFYLYLNMTKPSHRLYVSYSRVDSEGKALRPSYLIRTLLRMFPNMQVEELEDLEKALNTSTMEASKDYLIAGERTPEWYALAKCFLESEDERIRENGLKIVEAFYHQYHHDPISQRVAEAIYGKNIEGSVTRLEKFAQCAYAHFLSYGLHLHEREESGFESVDMGNLYHAAIEIYSKKLAASDYDWFNVPEDVRDDYAQTAMEEAVLAYPNLSIYATAENAHMAKRMNHIFKQTVWALTTQVRKGRFVPNDFEVSFSKADKLEALQFELENNHHIQLLGRIDRLDTCVDDDRLYVKVIDYKSGNTKFDLLKLYRGLQLQLVVYMNAAMELQKKKHSSKEIVPGAFFYYHIDDPVIDVTDRMDETQIDELILKELRPNGLVNSEESIYRAMDDEFEQRSLVIPVELKKDGSLAARSSVANSEEFELISEYVNNSIVRAGNDIYQGNVEVAPFTEGTQSGCQYCPYKAVCGFDVKIAGYETRSGGKLDKEEIFDKMRTENAIFKGRNKE